MREKKVLFVEGPDDKHTILAIRDRFNLPKTFDIQIPDGKGRINLSAKPTELGGVDNVLKAAEFNLIEGSSAIEQLGLVLDADQDLNLIWRRVLAILRKAGYENLPTVPQPEGTTITQEFMPTFGVWLMPDNKLRGMLEDFLAFLVPDKETNQIWAQAVKCSAEVLHEVAPEKRFADIHLCKAQIHAYLAWQKDCKPFGQAITAKYFETDKPECRAFVEWLKRLFID